MGNSDTEKVKKNNFVAQIIQGDLKSGKVTGEIITRFPPEPNGYLHIGHAKSICLNFGLAETFNGRCHLRFDDTNPVNEDIEYVDSIQQDIQWLGFSWNPHLYFASDYFDQLFDFAVQLIKKDLAYVDHSSVDEIRRLRGTLTEPGEDGPFRNRSVPENLELFEKMRKGDFAEGECVLRAKIDMKSPNMNLRDPLLYRIRKVHHQRTGDKWQIYPLYDFTHGLSDMIEGVTHSVCTLEFEDHRPLYDWILEVLETPCHPQQIEFARLNLDFTVMSKRKLLQLVEEGHVSGWDDPRMPTVRGMRRRGFTPESIRTFCDRIGVTKKGSVIELGVLENCVREDMDAKAPRRLAVLDPIKVTITNFPENEVKEIEVANHPKDESMGTRKISFSNEIYIDRDDFMEDPPKKYFRLTPDQPVRLRYGYVITCEEVIKDESGQVLELKCSYNPDTFAGKTPEGMKKVKGIIHWVNGKDAVSAKVSIYDRLFNVPNPGGDKEKDFKDFLNPDSLKVYEKAKLEASLNQARPEDGFQFERLGFFCADWTEHSTDSPCFNRTMTLRDTWAKLNK